LFRRLELLLICMALAVTLGLFLSAREAADRAARQEFQMIAEGGVQDLSARMALYMQSLNGAAALVNASDEVTAVDFSNYVATLDIGSNLPGINGVGLIVPVAADGLGAFEAGMRDRGVRDFTVHPPVAGPEHFIIQYIFPRQPNIQAEGLDIAFEEGRRTAAIRARETGQAQLTPRILLVQDAEKRPGFLLLRPVFTVPEPGAQNGIFRGWVYAPFVGANLLTQLSSDQLRNYQISVYDGEGMEPGSLIFSDDPAGTSAGTYAASYKLPLYGRTWTVHFTSTPGFDAVFQSRSPLGLLLGGLLLTAMLAYLLRAMRLRSDALAEIAALRSREIDARETENRAVMENAITPVIVLDGEDRVISANQAALICFGYDRAAFVGLDFDDFVTAAAELRGQARYHAAGRTSGGDALVLDVQRNAWTTLGGSQRSTVILRDITAQAEAIAAMEANRRRFDLALEGAEIGVFELDLISGRSVVSRTWCDVMGVPDEPASIDAQTTFLSRIHPEDLPAVRASDESCLSGRSARSTSEYRVRFGNDEWRWMKSDSVVTERDPDGRALRMVGTQTDITDLCQARFALEASEARFRMVVSEAPIGMAMMAENGEMLGVNEALCTLTGRSAGELMRMRLKDLVPEEDLKDIYRRVSTQMATGSTEPYRGEHRTLHVSGLERWGLFNISWAYDRNAGGNFFIAQINDITDQKQLDQMKSEFVSTVSHELRTPLTSIKGALGLLRASGQESLSGSGQRLVEIATSNVDRLTSIVNDILDLEKISAGNVAFNFDDIDLGDLVETAVCDMSPFATTHHNTLVPDLPQGGLAVHADRGRLMQVLVNLVSNACKYSDEGSDVVIKAERLEDVAIVYVQNSGPGVPESFRSRIFKAFSQADSSDTRAKGGTGLGLNITRQIILRHGGKVGFESVPNGPTVFWFTVPLSESVTPAASETRDAPLSPPERHGPLRELPHSRLKVLHLEDDRDFAEVVRRGLAPYAQITHAGSLAQAREAIGRDHFDVVILDWTLRDGDAAELLDEIEKAHPQARIFGLTADGTRKRDPRVLRNIVKSETDLSGIVSTITTWLARAS
jgi:PAS domain S-box-containing protein